MKKLDMARLTIIGKDCNNGINNDDRYNSLDQNISCLSRAPYYKCAINGSSAVLTFIIEGSFCYTPVEEWHIRRYKRKILSNFTMHVDFYIYNVTIEDDGYYGFFNMFDPIKLQVFKLWFINQTHLKTIVGQEGEAIEIVCSCDTEQYITALTLESNGTIKAIGDNQTVSYSFIPDRTDHLTTYQCVDSKHSSIMIEVELSIKYAPAVTLRYTNGTIECDCDGVPPVYSVYRLDRISKYGELVYSNNLDNGTYIFRKDQFPYQRNGRYMCFVSNGILGSNGKELQNSSTHVNYEGPPVFAKENRYVNHGKVEKSSIRMSFLVYSCPDVEEIFLQKLGRMRGKKRKLHKYILKSTLLYNELDNETGVPGYDILIESDDLDIEDFQAYIITVTNRLGASDYHFEIIKKEDRDIDQREKKYVFTICIVVAVLFGSIVINIGFCVNRARPKVPIQSNMNEDRTYHTYDEIGTILHGSVSNVRPSETHDNQDDIEQSSDQKSQTSGDSDSESSLTVMVGNVGDGYENPYQSVLLDRPEGHQYTQITIERNTSISSAESNCEMQILEKSLTKEGGYINLQF
ncbi:unnamed protein product [Mytilus edulis]|uniref:Ig-like domain-containing protein n=1 Tax=Mytilus edulis TaxID=6550 RepID=A0A8S3RQ99_MYTED|nr:unnamed protein product [Mytilus edulis]